MQLFVYITITYCLPSFPPTNPCTGRIESCQQVNAPHRSYQNAALVLTGRVGGADLQETRSIRLWKNSNLTSIQTDKYRYKPGQEVKFRVLTVHGSKALVATDPVRRVMRCE